jgi:hypothetical protein
LRVEVRNCPALRRVLRVRHPANRALPLHAPAPIPHRGDR